MEARVENPPLEVCTNYLRSISIVTGELGIEIFRVSQVCRATAVEHLQTLTMLKVTARSTIHQLEQQSLQRRKVDE